MMRFWPAVICNAKSYYPGLKIYDGLKVDKARKFNEIKEANARLKERLPHDCRVVA